MTPRACGRMATSFVLCVLPSLADHPGLVGARSAAPAAGAELFGLANGMRWIAAPMESPGEATVLFYVATGSAHESDATRGATATLVELWRLGAAEDLAARGALATAFFANPDFTVARATWPSGRLAVEPLLPQELEEAKQRLAGGPQGWDARTHGQHIADWLAMTGDFRPAFEHASRLPAVTAEQVLALARRAFCPENRTVVRSAVVP